MMDIDNKNWTPKVLAAWREVGEVAKSKGHRITNIYHLLLCLWNNSNSSFEMFLENSGISLRPKNINELLDKLAKKKAHLFFDKNSEPIIEKSIQKCLKSSIGLGKKFNNVFIGVEHFIWGILDSDPEFCDFLLENGIDTEHLKLCIEAFIRGEMVNDEEEMDEEEYFDDDEGVKESEVRKENSQLKSSQLKRFCILVNEVVKAPEFGIISGRESEITNLEEILCCKTKSNCILIGEAGTGKTSVVEGLAQFISSEGYSGPLKNKKIYSLDVGGLIAGSKYRGQFEMRFTKLLEELKADKDAIIFIDEIHTIIGAGGREGSPDLANLLKPALARGEIKCIGATTSTEYKKFFERDGALSRRFHHIYINEPNVDAMKSIARKAIKGYEKYHGVKFPVKNIDLAINMCETYLPHKRFIDKAFDVIDRAFAKAKMKNSSIVEVENVLSVISELSGLDASVLEKNLHKDFSNILDNFKESIYGQDAALQAIYDALACAKAGFRDEKKPLASFLFVGPTSVGKTHAAKKISEEFFGNGKSFLHLNMSEYQESSSISRLIGASAGYIGYEDGGILTEFTRNNPNSLILFDEIDKCHPTILNLLLQILDEANIKDNLNRDIDFSKSIVVMTSNAKAISSKTSHIGFCEPDSSVDSLPEKFSYEGLSPEILSRIGDVINFAPLTKSSLQRIFDACMSDLIQKAKKRKISISSKIKIEEIEKKYATLHAREIKHLFRKKIETPVAHFIAKSGGVKKLLIKVVDNQVVVS